MKRREFFNKTGLCVTSVLASRLGLSGHKNLNIMPVENSGPDFNSLRKDFPPLQKFRAYLDTAFVGLMSRQIKAAHEMFLEERFHFGPFSTDKSILGIWMDKMEKVRKKLAAFLGAKESEIAFTLCTGCGSNIALNGIEWRKGDNVVIDDLEYPTDFHILNSLKEKGVEVRIARNKRGFVSSETFEALTNKRTRAFVVSHVSYLNGFRHNLKKLADIIHSFNGYLIVDSAQAVGGIRVDVKSEDVDFLSGIPYKWLNGPNGVGFVYVREDLVPLIKPDRLGWASTHDFKSLKTMESNPLPKDARRFEYGTLAFESIYALDAALDYTNQIGIEAIEKRNLMLINLLRGKLGKLGVDFYTPENTASPILSFFSKNEREIGRKLKEQKIYITARRWGRGQIRISPHFYNNEQDIEAFVKAYSALHS